MSVSDCRFQVAEFTELVFEGGGVLYVVGVGWLV